MTKLKRTRGLTASVFFAILVSVPSVRAASEPSPTLRLAVLLKSDPRDDAMLTVLAREAAALNEIAEAQEKEFKARQKELRQTVGLNNLPAAELEQYFHGPADVLLKRDARGLAEIVRLARTALEAKSGPARDACLLDLREVMNAMQNDRRARVPEILTLSSPFKFLFRDWRRSVGRGTALATNLAVSTGGSSDPSLRDPAPSNFWARPPNIPEQDLYAGFGRDRPASLADEFCVYDGPKTSYGTRAGFDVEFEGVRYQIKFGEVNSEPFTARIFHALGYHADPTDYASRVKVRYDRRLLREFNLRQPLTMRVRPLGIPLGSIELQPRREPFNFVLTAVFKDGRCVSGVELKNLLLREPDAHQPEDKPGNFREDVEAVLDYLVMPPANVQPKDTPAENIGAWEFGGLGHEHRRELRGAALLAAWLGWSDTRWDNTRLRVAKADGRAQLQFFLTDLGAGLGGATGWFKRRGEDPNPFAWTFTRPEIERGQSQMTKPFRVVHFQTLVPTPACRKMTVDDARWMARLIGQLTEEQLLGALIASGYDAAETKLYLEKLVSRRDQMIRDLDLANQILLLRTDGVNRSVSFDPATAGPVTVLLKSGETVAATATRQTVTNGKLVRSSKPRPDVR